MEPSRPAATPLKSGTGTAVAGGGEPPYDGNMEHRITALEARWDAIIPTLATKADLAELRAELRTELHDGLHQNAIAISEFRSEMHQGFANVDRKFEKMSADNKSWMLATVLAIIGTMLAAILGISQVYKAAPPPTPIIITVPAAAPVSK